LTTSGRKPRLKTLERATPDQLPPLRPTKRDLAIIYLVYLYRVLTSTQIGQLLFASEGDRPYGKDKRRQARLKLLFHHEYLYRDEQPTKLSQGRLPLIYTLDEKGIQYLARELKLDRAEIEKQSNPGLISTSNLFLNHLLKTNDVRLAVALAAQKQNVEIKEWRDEGALKQAYDKVTVTGPRGGSYKVAVIPDAYFWLQTVNKNFHQFLEIDLRTVVGEYSQEGRKDWARRVRAYVSYYRSGLYQERFLEAGKSMRVLTVTTGPTRLQNLKAITERVAGNDRRRFWYTCFEDLSPETALTEPIWQVAGQEGLQPLIW
jgi:hypothetical protein